MGEKGLPHTKPRRHQEDRKRVSISEFQISIEKRDLGINRHSKFAIWKFLLLLVLWWLCVRYPVPRSPAGMGTGNASHQDHEDHQEDQETEWIIP